MFLETDLQKLHALTKTFVTAITASTRRMPYGMRCIARELLLALRVKFPDDTEEAYAIVLGRVIYYRLLNPAIVYVPSSFSFFLTLICGLDIRTPETFDIVHNTIPSQARRNLAEIAKILTQITSGELFGDDSPCLTPLNNYVSEAIEEMTGWLLDGEFVVTVFVVSF